MARSPLRDEIGGFDTGRDRLWQVTGRIGRNNFVAGLTEYNGEITGCAPILKKICTGTFLWAQKECTRRGWKIEPIEDRR